MTLRALPFLVASSRLVGAASAKLSSGWTLTQYLRSIYIPAAHRTNLLVTLRQVAFLYEFVLLKGSNGYFRMGLVMTTVDASKSVPKLPKHDQWSPRSSGYTEARCSDGATRSWTDPERYRVSPPRQALRHRRYWTGKSFKTSTTSWRKRSLGRKAEDRGGEDGLEHYGQHGVLNLWTRTHGIWGQLGTPQPMRSLPSTWRRIPVTCGQ